MKLKYLIPYIGLYFIWKDIPHQPNQYSYKPLQGAAEVDVMAAQFLIALLTTLLIAVCLN
jgi:hypothetical protein